MAVAALLRSVASKMARASPTQHLPRGRGLHGGARSGPGASSPPPPTSNQQGSADRGVGMAAAAELRSLAINLACARPPPHRLLCERGLHNSAASGSTPPTSKMEFSTVLAKTRAGVAYVTLFGSVIYMYGWVMPQLDRLEAKLDARKRSNLNDSLTQAIEAVELLLDEVATNVSEVQSSGHGKQPVGGATGNGARLDKLKENHCRFKELEAAREELQAKIAKLKDLQAEITELKMASESARSKGKV